MRRKIVLFALSLALTFAAFVPRAEAACVEGKIRNVATADCCFTDLKLWEIWQCQGGVWVPTGGTFCSQSCLS